MRGFRSKLLLRNKKLKLINIIFLIFLILNYIWRFNSTSAAYFNGLFVVNGYYLLIALINGYTIGATEINSKCSEIFESMYDVKRKIINEKLFIGIIFSVVIWIINILLITVFLFIDGENLVNAMGLYVSTINMLLLPIIISTMIGIFIGDNIKKEKAYILLTVIWLFITPLNEMVYSPIELFNEDTILRWCLTLGSIYSDSFEGIIGAYTHNYEFAKLGVFLFGIGCFYIHKYTVGKKYVYLVSLVGIGMCFYSINENRYNINDDMERWRTSDFYALESELNLKEKDSFSNYIIEKYKVNFTPGNQAEFEITMEVKLNEATNHLSFMLFNDFEITSLSDGENSKITFIRDEDFVDVKLGRDFDKGEKILLNLEYEGAAGKEFFIREQGIHVNSRVPYLPSNKIHNVMDTNGFASYFNLSVPSYYEVKVNDEKKYYSNLEETKKNTFKGYSDGMLLVSGDNIIKEKFEDVNYYYGRLQKYQVNEKVNVLETLKSIKIALGNAMETLNDTLGEKNFEDIKNVFVIYSRDLTNIELIGDTVVLYSNHIGPIEEDNYIRIILEERLKGIETEEKTQIARFIFIESIISYIQKIELNEVPQITFHNNENEREIHDKLVKVINSLSDDKKSELYNEFYQLCLTDIDYVKLDELAERYKDFRRTE